MFLSRIQVFVLSILVNYLVPLASIVILIFIQSSAYVVAFFVLLAFLFYKVSAWEMSWYYFRYVMALLIAVGVSLQVMRGISYELNPVNWAAIVLDAILFGLGIRVLLASRKPKTHIELQFPFKNGRFLITDGGDGRHSSLVNYHYKSSVHKKGKSNNSMMYAVDIVKLGKVGFSIPNLLTTKNTDYASFMEDVYSPCSGVVLDVVSSEPDNVPFSRQYPYSLGNHIKIQHEDTCVMLGHFAVNSIVVQTGQVVQEGQRLGAVGNSGLTPRPHLHIQASRMVDELWTGDGVPIVFSGQFVPIKNRVYKSRVVPT